MIVKVCGIKSPENFQALSKLDIDMIGFNFYAKSKRFINSESISYNFSPKHNTQKRVGVFVNHPVDQILRKAEIYELDYAQLHGDEDEDLCRVIGRHIPVIKVFRIDEHFDFSVTEGFEFADLFLFDTRVKEYGGSGKKFPWELLESYKGSTPFLLSGGIGPEDADRIIRYNHPCFVGVDINSRFETEPGVKDLIKVREFVKELRIEN